MTTVIYPGSFDPVTNGHLDIVARAAKLFDKVVVAVYDAPPKKLMFSTTDRVDLFKRAVRNLPRASVISYKGLTVDLAHKVGAKAIVRGLRLGSDFDFEFELALMNKQLASDVETVCLMSDIPYQFLSSTLMKEAGTFGGDISRFVPKHVQEAMSKKLKQKS